MATLHFICGKAASGKTTLARELAARHAAVLFGEDEWLTRLDVEINSLADHVRHLKRLKAALAPLAVRLLQLGVPIVFDFAGNTPNDRAWVRSIFERASADHVLHYIIASDESCKARLRLRNEAKPEGLYFGFVSEDRFEEVTRVAPEAMIFGYAWVSTDGQSAEAQVRQLRAAGARKVFREVARGAKTDRAQLRRVLAELDAGDVLTVTRLDRLARSTRDL